MTAGIVPVKTRISPGSLLADGFCHVPETATPSRLCLRGMPQFLHSGEMRSPDEVPTASPIRFVVSDVELRHSARHGVQSSRFQGLFYQLLSPWK
jgi:hypothetical protein